MRHKSQSFHREQFNDFMVVGASRIVRDVESTVVIGNFSMLKLDAKNPLAAVAGRVQSAPRRRGYFSLGLRPLRDAKNPLRRNPPSG